MTQTEKRIAELEEEKAQLTRAFEKKYLTTNEYCDTLHQLGQAIKNLKRDS